MGPQGLPGLPFGVVNLNCQTQKIRDWRPFAFFYSSIWASQLWECCCLASSETGPPDIHAPGKIGWSLMEQISFRPFRKAKGKCSLPGRREPTITMGIHIRYEIRNQWATKSFPTSQRRYMCYSISYRHRVWLHSLPWREWNPTPKKDLLKRKVLDALDTLGLAAGWFFGTRVALNHLNSCGAPGPTRPLPDPKDPRLASVCVLLWQHLSFSALRMLLPGFVRDRTSGHPRPRQNWRIAYGTNFLSTFHKAKGKCSLPGRREPTITMGIHIPYEIRNQWATKSFPTSQRRYMCYSISYRHRVWLHSLPWREWNPTPKKDLLKRKVFDALDTLGLAAGWFLLRPSWYSSCLKSS